MPNNDSIHSLKDSTLNIVDSLKNADSLLMKDTVLHVPVDTVKFFEGYSGDLLPLIPRTETWVFGVTVFLFFLLIIIFNRSSDWITYNLRYFFKNRERISLFSKTTAKDIYTKALLVVFSAGVYGFFAYLNLYNNESFLFVKYLYFFLAVLLFYATKYLLLNIMGYVFLDQASLKMGLEYHYNILFFFAIALFPVVFLQIYIPEEYGIILQGISLFLFILSLVAYILKLFQIFFKKIVVSFYILLYLCTLEILPLIILYSAFRMLV